MKARAPCSRFERTKNKLFYARSPSATRYEALFTSAIKTNVEQTVSAAVRPSRANRCHAFRCSRVTGSKCRHAVQQLPANGVIKKLIIGHRPGHMARPSPAPPTRHALTTRSVNRF
ncbi:unnamed protein product, partial [Iphiclides podalirius]